jgi:hypothetical protein
MQTFLPLPDYELSAKVLDDKRLGKQRVEVLQILNVLHEVSQGWRHHPAVRMWRGYEPQLCEYGLVVCEVWKSRGFKDSCWGKINQHLDWACNGDYKTERPKWFGDPAFHLAHQSALVRKDPDHYLHYFPATPPDLPYIWPVN